MRTESPFVGLLKVEAALVADLPKTRGCQAIQRTGEARSVRASLCDRESDYRPALDAIGIPMQECATSSPPPCELT